MMKTFPIFGTIVDTAADKWCPEDVCPEDVRAFLDTLQDGDEVEVEINSPGGSVFAGLAICNMLKQRPCTAHVIGLAASMASAIACACTKLRIDDNALMMLHNPYTATMGNADELRKEAETLDTVRDALLTIYQTKFKMDADELMKVLDDETWFSGKEVETFKLDAEVVPTGSDMRIAACIKPEVLDKFGSFKAYRGKMEGDVEKQASEQVVEEAITEPVAETVEDEVVAEEAPTEVPEMVTKAEADKRVSGMQSAMAKQIDALKKDYEARLADAMRTIDDLNNQNEATVKELESAIAESTRLANELENAQRELRETASALESKKDALANLAASALTPADHDTKPWKKLSGEALRQWCREHQPIQ